MQRAGEKGPESSRTEVCEAQAVKNGGLSVRAFCMRAKLMHTRRIEHGQCCSVLRVLFN